MVGLYMSKSTTHELSVMPTKAEIDAWNRMTRDEQLAALRAELNHPECKRDSSATMQDIRNAARAEIARLRDADE